MDALVYEGFDSKYDTPLSIEYHVWEKNNWFYALFNYTKCYKDYYKAHDSYFNIKAELEKENINNVCKHELDEVRKAANSGLTYKEVNGHVRPIMKDYL
jgi:hypothetical protein